MYLIYGSTHANRFAGWKSHWPPPGGGIIERAKALRWATWALLTPTLARRATLFIYMNNSCQLFARLATAETKALCLVTWALPTPDWARPAAPFSCMNKH